jgi:hypothetical protein
MGWGSGYPTTTARKIGSLSIIIPSKSCTVHLMLYLFRKDFLYLNLFIHLNPLGKDDEEMAFLLQNMRTYIYCFINGFWPRCAPMCYLCASVFLRSKLRCSSLQRKSTKNPRFGIKKKSATV